MKLTIATCQFDVSADISHNEARVCRQIRQAAERGADIVHFCEGALSGYVMHDFKSFDNYNWASLREATERVLSAARDAGVFVVLGSSHPLSRGRKPHNSVYIIDDMGRLVTRYDKRFCASDEKGKGVELAHFSPGDHATVFKIKGVRCGVLVCHEYRYPELYRELEQKNVEVVFHSFHAANIKKPQLAKMEKEVGLKNHKWNNGKTYPEITMPAAIQTHAQSNYLWISAANSSARESAWAAFMVRPDGVKTGQLRRNTNGILLTTIDTREEYYDSTRAWRRRAMKGQLHSGKLVKDPRSENLREL